MFDCKIAVRGVHVWPSLVWTDQDFRLPLARYAKFVPAWQFSKIRWFYLEQMLHLWRRQV